MPKTFKKKSSAKRKISKRKRIIVILGLISLIAISVIIGYFLGQKENKALVKKDTTTKHSSHIIVKKKIVVEHKQVKIKKKSIKKSKKIKIKSFSGKPKLVIIIDDVHNKKQLDIIQKIDLKLTPSIFPPYSLSPRSHFLARHLKHHMIHLPMESANNQLNSQDYTLMTTDSLQKIQLYIKKLHALFPNAKYINNHTGSVFTQNYIAMKNFYHILRKEGFMFIDSYTTKYSKVHKVAAEYGDEYVARNVFIDDEQKMSSIYKELQRAIQIAKKKGYAIAIGHPHAITMKALNNAKTLLRDVDVVYIDEIYQ